MSRNFNQNDYFPKRFGLQYEPPAIVLEYMVKTSGKLYHHKMKIPGQYYDRSNEDILNLLKTKHHLYFLSGKIKDNQISVLLDKIKSRIRKERDDTTNILGNQNFSKNNNKENLKEIQTKKNNFMATREDLNKKGKSFSFSEDINNNNIEPKQIEQQQQLNPIIITQESSKNDDTPPMSPEFKPNFSSQQQQKSLSISKKYSVDSKDGYSDEQFESPVSDYNSKQITNKFDEIQLDEEEEEQQQEELFNANKKGVWDDLELGDDDDDEDFEDESQIRNKKQNQYNELDDDFGMQNSPQKNNNNISNGIDYDTYDLNKLSPSEVKKHKEQMEAGFKRNSLKPGDIGYQYDLRKDFEQNDQENDWDDED